MVYRGLERLPLSRHLHTCLQKGNYTGIAFSASIDRPGIRPLKVSASSHSCVLENRNHRCLLKTTEELPAFKDLVIVIKSVIFRKAPRRRLDELCVEKYPEVGKSVIVSWIAQGKIVVDKKVIDKAGTRVAADANIVVNAKLEKFVCRAGKKLEAALDHFKIEVKGLHALDSGISTGGFSDCLLQRGAASIVGVDVGYGQVAERVRVDPRVTVMERTNLRHLRLADLPQAKAVELVTLDLSFISVITIVDQLCTLMTSTAGLVVLIKPQFEAARNQVQPGGVVIDPLVHEEVIGRVTSEIEKRGFSCQGVIASPIAGAVSSNKEFLAYFQRRGT